MNKIKLMIVTAMATVTMSITAFAGQWRQDTTGWWYQNDDMSYPTNVLKQIDGPWYYFDGTGYMKTGDLQLSDGWYSFRADGTCSNPTSQTIGYPVGAPAVGWVEYTDKTASTLQEIADGRVVYFNNIYWASPDYVNNLKDLAERDMIKRDPTTGLVPGAALDFSNATYSE